MTTTKGYLHTLALIKQRYTRGSSWTQILLSFGIITANAKLFEDFFTVHFGLTMPGGDRPSHPSLRGNLLPDRTRR